MDNKDDDNPMAEFLDGLFDKAIEEKKYEHQNQLESFESYKKRTKLQCHEAYNDYIKHLQHGYQVIIDEIDAKMAPPSKL